jgi:hypothetical protein
MIITTFNARDLVGWVKRKKVKELIRLNNIEFLAIQETRWRIFLLNFVLVFGEGMIVIGLFIRPKEVMEVFFPCGGSLVLLLLLRW